MTAMDDLTEAIRKSLEKHPNQRFGQLLFNQLERQSVRDRIGTPLRFREEFHRVLFYIEDSALIKVLTAE